MADEAPKDLNISLTELHSAVTALAEKLDKIGRPQCAECSCGPCYTTLCYACAQPCAAPCHAPCVITLCQPCYHTGPQPLCQPCYHGTQLCTPCANCTPCTAQCVTAQCARCVCCTPCTPCAQCQ